jgi:hypothetical protein
MVIADPYGGPEVRFESGCGFSVLFDTDGRPSHV